MLRSITGASLAIALIAAPGIASAQSIVDVAAGNPEFSTLVAAVSAAGLADTLAGDGPFTVFAPTNAAFEALPDGTLEQLLMPENIGDLQSILTYHVVPGTVMAADVLALTADGPAMAATVNGADVPISVEDGMVMVGEAQVVTTDIAADNGVIHVIDTVILPPME